MVEQLGIGCSVVGCQHCVVGLVFMHTLQFSMVEINKRVEPKHYFNYFAQQEVEGMALAHMYHFVSDELLHLSRVESVAT